MKKILQVIDNKIIKIPLNKVHLLPELKNAFEMSEEVKNRIKFDIEKNGFSRAKPIHIFWYDEKWCLADGHTRFQAASELGLKTIWAQIHNFDNLNKALLFSYKEQFNRRNTEDAALIKQFILLQQEEKLTADEMSNLLHKSKRHIFKLQFVLKNSSKQQLESINDGTSTINKIYNEIKQVVALDKNSNIPKSKKKSLDNTSINIETEFNNEKNNSLSKQKINIVKKTNNTSPIVKSETKSNGVNPNQLTDKQILLLGAKYALVQIAKGKTVAEILDTSVFSDSIKATDITFEDNELDLLEAM